MNKVLYILLLFFSLNTYSQVLEAPTANFSPGIYLGPIDVALSHSDPDVTIFYTLNGNEPGPGDAVYSGSITMDNRDGDPNIYSMIPTNPSFTYPVGGYNASRANNRGWLPPYTNSYKVNVLRFRAYKPGTVPSETITKTYIIDPSGTSLYSLPIVSIVLDSVDLFSDESGIYVFGDHPEGNYSNKGEAWERMSHFEYFEPDGTLGYSQNARARIHGGGTRHSTKKNFRLYGETGELKNFKYKFFDNVEISKFKRILIRAGGHRPDCFPRDDLANLFTEGLNADQQHFKHIIVFLNGEYWGIHAIKERVDKYFLQNQFGIDDDEITILDQEFDVQDGYAADSLEMAILEDFINVNDMNVPANYQYALDRIDMDSYIDYMCSEIFLSNEDWVYSNVVIWRKTGPYDPSKPAGHDGKFRWVFYDFDGAFGGSCNNAYYTVNTLGSATVETGIYTSYTRFFRGLLENDNFRRDFINRMCDLSNSWFKSTVTTEKMWDLYDKLTPEMMENVERWRYPSMATTLADRDLETPSLDRWNETFDLLDRFLRRRASKVVEDIMQKWSYTDTSFVTVDVNDVNMGEVKLNSLHINEQLQGVDPGIYPWTGRYINDVEIPLVANAYPGYEFVEWLETGETNDTILISLNSDSTFTAVFQESTGFENVLINEVMPSNENNYSDIFGDFDDWLEFYNPNPYPVSLGNCIMERDGLTWRIPNDFIVDANGFRILWFDNEVYQGEDHVSYKLPNAEHTVFLKNSNGDILDQITYPNTDTDNSFGRFPNGSGTFASFTFPTPLQTNDLASTSAYDFEALYAYPNPSNSFVNLSRISNFEMYDLQGRIVKTGVSTNQINVDDLNKGTYILKTDLGEKLKIVVQ